MTCVSVKQLHDSSLRPKGGLLEWATKAATTRMK